MSKIKWRDCVRDIQESKIEFVIDYDMGNVMGFPSLFQLKLFVHQMFDIVYFYSKSEYAISSENKYITLYKDEECYFLKVGKYESTVKLEGSLI